MELNLQSLSPGTLLSNGNYRIVRVIGRGGFGITYEAINTRLDIKVAIKEFFPKGMFNREPGTEVAIIASLDNSELIRRLKSKFVKEAKRLAVLRHESIVGVNNAFEENGTAYFVMDFVKGRSLDEMVKEDGPIEVRRAIRYINQAADALSYLHNRQINHLDIKPANILVESDGNNVKLIDFGLSKQYDSDGMQTSTTPVGVSHGYAPVEQYQPGGVGQFSASTDIYALGATLYYLLTGQRPPTAMALEDEIMIFPAHIPDHVQSAILKAMALKKTSRFQSVDEFVKALKGNSEGELAGGEGRENKKTMKGVVVGLIIAAIVGAVVFFIINRSSTLQPDNDTQQTSHEESIVTQTEKPGDEETTPSKVQVIDNENEQGNNSSIDRRPETLTVQSQTSTSEDVKSTASGQVADAEKPQKQKVDNVKTEAVADVANPQPIKVASPLDKAISQNPRNLDLVVERDGKRGYIGAGAWKKLTDEERASVNKIGIYLEGRGQRFAFSLRNQSDEKGLVWDKAKRYEANLPTKEQAQVILDNLDGLKNALRDYAMNGYDIQQLTGWYWTQSKAGQGRMWCLNINKKSLTDYPVTVSGKVRFITAL